MTRSFWHFLRANKYGALAAGLAFGLYWFTLAPTVMWYDMGEFAVGSGVLGIGHNSGYPLYMILGKLFTLLPIGDVAYRVNLMSAVWAEAYTLNPVYPVVLEKRPSAADTLQGGSAAGAASGQCAAWYAARVGKPRHRSPNRWMAQRPSYGHWA